MCYILTYANSSLNAGSQHRLQLSLWKHKYNAHAYFACLQNRTLCIIFANVVLDNNLKNALTLSRVNHTTKTLFTTTFCINIAHT